MNQMVLLKSQQNEVLEMIKDAELEPFNFGWSLIPSEKTKDLQISKIDYIGSGFFYKFEIYQSNHLGIYSPGKGKLIDEEFPGSWETQKFYVGEWLSYLKREIDQPDLWSEISKYRFSPESELRPDLSNESFTPYQMEKIVGGLNQIRNYIKEMRLASEEQYKFVDDKLDYLIDAAKRQGRKDWFYTCIGVICTIAATLALSPDQGNTLWRIIKNTISGIIQFLPK